MQFQMLILMPGNNVLLLQFLSFSCVWANRSFNRHRAVEIEIERRGSIMQDRLSVNGGLCFY